MPEEVKIGVYICHCGTNISQSVNVVEVAKYAETLQNVARAREYKYMCSDPGQDMIKGDIKELGLNRVVVASCSPLMHEPTFRYACNSAGLNPYLFQMCNIREQCSWVHQDMKMATEKAKALVNAAVRRVVYHKALEPRVVDVNPNALIVGGGITGIEAALKIADAGKRVYLVEKEPSIGGHMAKFDKTFPTLDCSACILTPKMVQAGRHPNIELLTYSKVEEVKGFVGNFEVTVRKKARSVDLEKCTGCAACVEHCPVQYEIYEPKEIKVEIDKDTEAKLKVMLDKCKEMMIYKDKDQRGLLLPLLHEVNIAYNHLPENILRYISKELEIPLSLVYQISTFYNAFSLKPRAKFTISVCMGTACYVKGGGKIVEAFQRELKIRSGETTSDLLFGLETASCFGCCGQAPVIMVNEDLHGCFKITKVPELLENYRKGAGVYAEVTA